MTRAPAGTTLVEVLLGIALGVVALAATASLLTAGLAARARAGAGADGLAAAAGAVDQIVRDVRLAGYDPDAAGFGGVADATSTSVVLEADLDGDGAVDASSEERVAYRLSAAGDALQRVVGAQVLPLVSPLAPGGFRLRYFDAAGAELDPADPGAADAVRAVTVTLATRARGGLPGVELSGGARLLNR
jgi:hypothetical protein